MSGVQISVSYTATYGLCARAPEHVVFIALSASVEPGKETQEVLRRIGFRHGAYHFDKRDCERHNVDYIFRNIQYAYTGHLFRDLDWLTPADMQKASDAVKCLLYSNSVETPPCHFGLI